jgi:glycerol-3-phosphate dehydrogenase (NAD(P)+)
VGPAPELADEITRDHRNSDYLADFDLPPDLAATASLDEAVSGADVLVMGVPSHGMRSTLRRWPSTSALGAGGEPGQGSSRSAATCA